MEGVQRTNRAGSHTSLQVSSSQSKPGCSSDSSDLWEVLTATSKFPADRPNVVDPLGSWSVGPCSYSVVLPAVAAGARGA